MIFVQAALQDEPRRSKWDSGPSLAEDRPKTGPEVSGQTAFKDPGSESSLSPLEAASSASSRLVVVLVKLAWLGT